MYMSIVSNFQSLEDNIELTKIKIERAEKLISGLGGEKERWTQVQSLTWTSHSLNFLSEFKHNLRK